MVVKMIQIGLAALLGCVACVGGGVLVGRALRDHAPEMAFIRGQNDLYVMDVEYNRIKRIARTDHDMNAPRWSRDGRKLAFTTVDGSGSTAIQSIDSDGSIQTLYEEAAPIWSTAWSPQADRLAFIADDQLYLMAADGTNPEPLDARIDTRSYSLSWSPDGETLAYIGSQQPYVYLLDVEDQEQRPLNDLPANPLARPMWSPDSQQLSFVSGMSVYTAKADGSGQQHVANTNIPRQAVWSPDGRLAYIANLQLYVVEPEGQPQLVDTGVAVTDTPVWSPDGRWLAFASGSELYVTDPDEGTARLVTQRSDNRAINDFTWRE